MMRLIVFISLSYLTLTNCVFSQSEKTLLTPITTELLANEICDCLKKDSTETENTKIAEIVKKCYTVAIVNQSTGISNELGIDIIRSNDLELGKKIGIEITKVLLKNCPIYSSMILHSASQNIFNQAENLRADKKFAEAIKRYDEVFTSVITIDKTVFNARGLCKYELGDYYGALADFEYAIQRDSMYANAYSNRGLTKAKLDKISDALTDYNRAIDLDSNTAIYYSNRGILYYENDYYEDAEKDLKKAIDKDSIVADNYYYLAQTKRLMKQFVNQTVEYYSKSIKLQPKNVVYLNDRGLYYWDNNELSKAKIDFVAAIQIDKNYNPAFYNLARLSTDAKQYEESLKYIDEAIKIDSTYDIYHQQKGRILMFKNSLKNALEEFNKAIFLDEKKAEFYDDRAEVYEKLGNYPNALKDLTYSIDMYNQDGKIYYRRGIIYLKMKNKKAACEDFLMGKLLKNEDAIKAVKINCP